MSHRWLLLALVAAGCRPETGPPPAQARLDLPWVVASSAEALLQESTVDMTPQCGAGVRLQAALPDPRLVDDRAGEWLELTHDEVEDVWLGGWRLEAGRRSRRVERRWIRAGETLRIGGGPGELWPVRLKNGEGSVRLIDPCGMAASSLRWGKGAGVRVGPGQCVEARPTWALYEETPPEVPRAGACVVAADGFEPST
jgi:hypothetical protein